MTRINDNISKRGTRNNLILKNHYLLILYYESHNIFFSHKNTLVTGELPAIIIYNYYVLVTYYRKRLRQKNEKIFR